MPVQPNMRERIEEIRRRAGHHTSSHAFASLYLWQDAMGLSAVIREDVFLIRADLFGENAFFFPCGTPEAVCRMVEEVLDSYGDSLQFLYLREEDVQLLDRFFPGRFLVTEDRDSSEYLYDRREYLAMEGKRFHHVRNDLNRLKEAGEVRFVPLEGEMIEAAGEIVLDWNRAREDEDRSHQLVSDENTSRFLLRHFEELGAYGRVALLDGSPAGVLAGSRICNDTFDLQMSKMKEPVRGLMYAMLKDLYENLPEEITLINREEDLGIPGLRTFKESLNPCGFNNMYTAKPILQSACGGSTDE